MNYEIDYQNLIEDKKTMLGLSGHSWRTMIYWVLVFVAGGIVALHNLGIIGDPMMILAFIGFAEHFLAGNTEPTPNS